MNYEIAIAFFLDVIESDRSFYNPINRASNCESDRFCKDGMVMRSLLSVN
ncbi:hypothetical protein [Merismopedia glauca]|nr:hypothetical protein [Merismopedia glauca]